MVFSTVAPIPNLNMHASGFNGKSIGPHQTEGLGQTAFNRINGREDPHQCHDPKCNDKDGQDRPEQIGPDGFQCNPYIF